MQFETTRSPLGEGFANEARVKRNRSMFKYYAERRWAEALMDGDLLFRSLAYFRDYEDEETRGDRNEGSAVFRPLGGLVLNNQTQGKTFTLTWSTPSCRHEFVELRDSAPRPQTDATRHLL